MERLKSYIEWLENGQGIDRDECLSYLRDALCDKEAFHDYEATGLTLAECAKLAAAKRDGRLAVLPCNIGDTVYSCQYGTGIFERKVLGFEFGRKNAWIRHQGGRIEMTRFGVTVFLTYGEAALKAKEAAQDD